MADARIKQIVIHTPDRASRGVEKQPVPRNPKAGQLVVTPTIQLVPPAGSGLPTNARSELHLLMLQGGGVAYWGGSDVAPDTGFPISETSTAATIISTKRPVYVITDQVASGNGLSWAEIPEY